MSRLAILYTIFWTLAAVEVVLLILLARKNR